MKHANLPPFKNSAVYHVVFVRTIHALHSHLHSQVPEFTETEKTAPKEYCLNLNLVEFSVWKLRSFATEGVSPKRSEMMIIWSAICYTAVGSRKSGHSAGRHQLPSRGLATANRSRVSIRVTKMFGQSGGVVDRVKKFLTSSWSLCKIWLLLPILSHGCVRACRRSCIFLGTLGPATANSVGVADPGSMLSSCVMVSNLVALGHTVWA